MRAILLLLAAVGMLSVARAAPPLEDYGKLPGIDFVTLSPSGERYAFVATVDNDRRLIVMNSKSEVLEQFSVGKVKVNSVWWAGDDHVLVRTSATIAMGMEFVRQKSEQSTVIVVNPTTHKSFAVFGDARQNKVAHTVRGDYGTAQIGGHWYGYFGGYGFDTSGMAPDLKATKEGLIYESLYRVDLDSGEFTLIVDDGGKTEDWLIRPTGDVAASMRFNYTSGLWSAVSAAPGAPQLAAGRYPDLFGAILGFGHDPSKVLVGVSDADGEKILELPLAGGPAIATYDREATGDPWFDRVSRLWIGSKSENGPSLFDASRAAKARGAIKAFPNYNASLMSYSTNFEKMVVFTEGGDDSGTYWMVDTVSRGASEIGHAYPSVRAADVGAISWVDYKAADGLAMRGVLTLPPGRAAKNLPLVVMPHGGPQAHDYLQFDYWAQAFASRGYAVFQPNFRGSDGYGQAFLDAGHGQWGRKMQTDVSDGVAELARQGIIDPKRACIVGWSYGGYAALAGVTIQQKLYKCAVSIGGVSDLAAHYRYIAAGSGTDITARQWKVDLGLASSQGNRLEDVSPIRLAARADAPILLIHGKDDTVVQASQSEDMEKALLGAGKSVKKIILPGADHWLLREETRVAMVRESVNFVLANNPPDPAP